MRFCWLLSIILITGSVSVSAKANLFLPDLKTAQDAYKDKDYSTAYKHWKALEEYNDPQSNLGLGRLYARGLGVPQDHEQSMLYFKRAAKENNAKSFYEIGFAYEKGNGVTQNLDKAKKWYQLSTEYGYQRGVNRLKKINSEYIEKEQDKKENKNSKWNFRSSLKSQLAIEDNLSLGSDQDSSSAFISEVQVTARYQPLKDIRIQTQVRALHSTGSATSNLNDDNETIMDESFLELRQAFVTFKNINNHRPLTLSLGRQKFSEDRRLWWNDELDAVKISYDTTLTSAFIALGENLSDYRFGDDQNMDSEEKSRLRLLGELSHKRKPTNTIEARFLYETDHSGQADVGSFIKNDNQDKQDQDLLWVGVQTKGLINNGLQYDASLMGVIGKETNTISAPTNTQNIRRVTNNKTRDVRGWAFDGKIESEVSRKHLIKGHAGYAYGSGDDGQGTNNSFSQTDLETNSSVFYRHIIKSATRHYGEVLRPELSNIHILNFGLHYPWLKHHDVNLNYYSYWRANEGSNIGNNNIDQSLSQNGRHIGQALDLISTIDLSYILPNQTNMFDQTYLKLRLGSFYSGGAYGAAKNDLALIANAQINVKF